MVGEMETHLMLFRTHLMLYIAGYMYLNAYMGSAEIEEDEAVGRFGRGTRTLMVWNWLAYEK